MIQFSEEEIYQPVRAVRASQHVADRLWRGIVSGKLRPGEVLPPERRLAERFGVTRNTVREALRSLEQLQLVSIRQGSGVTVRDYLASAGVELLVELLRADGLRGDLLGEVLEARSVLGRAMLSRAVQRFDPAHLEALEQVVAAFVVEAGRRRTDAKALLELEFDVHAQLLRGAGNRTFMLLHNTLRRMCRPIAQLFTMVVAEPMQLAGAYQRGVAAVASGDVETAVACFCATFPTEDTGTDEDTGTVEAAAAPPRRTS